MTGQIVPRGRQLFPDRNRLGMLLPNAGAWLTAIGCYYEGLCQRLRLGKLA